MIANDSFKTNSVPPSNSSFLAMMNAKVHSDGQSSAISRNVRLQNSLHIPGGCLNQFHSGNFASSRPTPTGVICFVIECERLQPDYARAGEYACARTQRVRRSSPVGRGTTVNHYSAASCGRCANRKRTVERLKRE